MRHCTIILCIMLTIMIGCKTDKEQSPSVATSDKVVLDESSEQTLGIALKFMEAMGNGDMETMTALMHEDMVWHNEGDKSLPWIGPWNGKKAILEEFMPLFGANFQTVKWEPNDAFANGDTAAFFGRMIGKLSKSNQLTEEFTYALRVKVKDGQVILWNWFEDSYAVSKSYHSVSK